jgi:Transglycosylase SLT domain
MKKSRARSTPVTPQRLLGIGTGVLLVTLATGARGPVSGSIEAFAKPSARVPITLDALPHITKGVVPDTRRPTTTTPPASNDTESTEIPAPALRAYKTAELIMKSSAPGCGLDWEILAGIGRVESDHGRFGGAVVATDGTSSPQIYGVPLNGVGDVAAIRDSDGGALDGDTVWDRAVGPMQFLPTTWDVVGVDADGDGVKNPHDLDDAALAAAVYLCAGDVDLRDRAQLREALLRYNPSTEYVDLVLSYIEAYRNSEPIPITVNPPIDQVPPLDETPGGPVHPPSSQPQGDPGDNPGNNPGTNPGPGNPGGDPGPGPGGPGPGGDPGPGPGGPGPGPDPGGPRPPGGGGNPDPDPPDPDPPPAELTGVLSYDEATGIWSISDNDAQLSFGTEEQLLQPSATDYDADGDTAETVKDELLGFVAAGTEVTVGVGWSNSTAIVHLINGKEYPSPVEPTPTEPTPTEPTASEPTPTGPTATEPTATNRS